jgi:hypothetical protein
LKAQLHFGERVGPYLQSTRATWEEGIILEKGTNIGGELRESGNSRQSKEGGIVIVLRKA